MFKNVGSGLMLLAVAGGLLSAHTGHHGHTHHKRHVPQWRKLCKPYEHVAPRTAKSHRYVIRNDDYGHKRECILNHIAGPNFAVVRSGARIAHAEPIAYPNIFIGCSWGVCSQHSGLPRRVRRLHSLMTSWSLRAHARGVWAASYDIWFTRSKHKSGQAKGAEIMIWLSSRGFGANKWPVVSVRHIRYHLAHWRTSHHGSRWNYIQFKRVRSTSAVRDLRVDRFIKVAEERGLIKPGWWLTSVEAGFEIWRGGVGLMTKQFSVHMYPVRS